MTARLQSIWNRRISEAGRNASKFSQDQMCDMIRESGNLWIYQQSPYNTDAYREGWERIFGNKSKD